MEKSTELRIYIYTNAEQEKNTYILWRGQERSCILIDPTIISNELFAVLEDNALVVRSVLFTRVHALAFRTIPNIYADVQFYGRTSLAKFSAGLIDVTNRESVRVNGLSVEPLLHTGASSDFCMYKVGNFLFTGEILQAGRVLPSEDLGYPPLLRQELRTSIQSLPPNTFVFPQYGPPSTAEIERRYNAGLRSEI